MSLIEYRSGDLERLINGETSSDIQLVQEFEKHFRIPDTEAKLERLSKLVHAFSRIPYENLTKVLKFSQIPQVQQAKRTPGEVLKDHYHLGAGGTCFSLTLTLLQLVRALGFRAEPILADRHYGQDTHCAMIVWIEGQAHLLDPGFLILDPVPLDSKSSTEIQTSFNRISLEPRSDGSKLALHTLQNNQSSERLTFKLETVDASQFIRAWDSSFSWDMMRYPVLTHVQQNEHVYLQKGRVQRRSIETVQREEITSEDLAAFISKEFGLNAQVAEKALTVLKQMGEEI